MKFLNLLFFLFLISLVPGQLTRFELNSQLAFYLHDVVLALLIISCLIYFFARKKNFFLPKGVILVLIFILTAIVSQINSARFFPNSQTLTGSLFLFRFIALFLIYPVLVNLISKKQLNLWANLIISLGIILALLGFFQLIFFYDLSFLQSSGYDPHIGRLVSTFLDPNFFGGFEVIVLNLTIAKFLTTNDKKLIFVLIILFTAIILTFSRSSYLALFTSIFLFGILRSKKLAITIFGLFLLFTPVVPRILERILGAVTLDVTASARIESWLQAIRIFSTSPLLGVGFNNLRFAKSKLGFFEISERLGGHAGAGVDSSLLLVLATTGILGLITFLGFNSYLAYKNFKARHGIFTLATFVTLIAIFIHSQFVNSLLFPWIAALLWIKIAMSDVETNFKS